MFTGGGSQSDTQSRWGDYSMTTIDPANGMDFWTVGEYYATTSSFNWHTRVGKFNFQGGGQSPTPTPTATPASCSWAAGANLPSVGVRAAGVFFPANGKFYAMGGRMSDSVGSEFTNPFEYDPVANTWTTKSAIYPDNHVNNMACGVLTDAGTPYIYCVGGNAVTFPDISDRVFRYNPVTDVISVVAAPWPAVQGMVLPGGFTVFNNKLYLLGGFDTITNGGQGINQIWEFTPSPAAWVQKNAVLPVPLGYIPTTTIGSLIYTGGGSDITAGLLTDTTNAFVYNPVADTIGTIASIPRATGETRALNFCNNMYVMGGGRTPPNPSNEVDVYDPVSNTWSLGQPFVNARRNFPTDTNGTDHIWLAGGYDINGAPTDSMEIFSCPVSPCGSPSPTPTATATATATATPAPRSTPTPRPRPTPPPRP
jgi:Kelch motif